MTGGTSMNHNVSVHVWYNLASRYDVEIVRVKYTILTILIRYYLSIIWSTVFVGAKLQN